jgi:hypothetical protein
MSELETLIDDLRREAETDRDSEDVPEVGIIMGSDSDLPTMAGASEAPAELGSGEVPDLDVPGLSTSDLYLIRSFIDGYDGRIRVRDGDGRAGFAVEFPVGAGFIDGDGGIVKKAD